jgi:hypothetical protein
MPKAFLITPFSPESAGNENPQRFATVQAAVNEATKLAGVDLVHPAQIKASGVIPTFLMRSNYSHGEFVLLAMLDTRKNWPR